MDLVDFSIDIMLDGPLAMPFSSADSGNESPGEIGRNREMAFRDVMKWSRWSKWSGDMISAVGRTGRRESTFVSHDRGQHTDIGDTFMSSRKWVLLTTVGLVIGAGYVIGRAKADPERAGNHGAVDNRAGCDCQ